MKTWIFLTVLCIFGSAANAQSETLVEFPKPDQLLNGTTLIFEYTNGRGFYLSFYDNKLKYQLNRNIANPESVGSNNQDIPYRSRKIGDNIYQVFWHEPRLKDTVSMVINLNNRTLFASGLLGYDGRKHEVFDAAIIKQIIEE